MIQGWEGHGRKGFAITLSPGPDEDRFDCFVRLSPLPRKGGLGYTAVNKSPLRQAFYGDAWVYDDGDLLIANRILEAAVLSDLKIGDPAPPLSAKTFDGGTMNLEDYRGKYLLLDFWATWCGPCVAEIPRLAEVHKAFAEDERFAMIGLSLDEEIQAPKKFVEGRGLPWDQGFLGSESSVVRDYGVGAIPAIFLIDPDGKVVAKGLRGDKLEEVLIQALGKK